MKEITVLRAVADRPEIDALRPTFEDLAIRALRLSAEVQDFARDTRAAEWLLSERTRAVTAALGATGKQGDRVVRECCKQSGHTFFEDQIRELVFAHPFH